MQTTVSPLSTEQLLNVLKAAGESTRLRLLALLADGELNVKDLTKILGQSQPRISRHLKLMTEAGLVERFREGSWVYFRLSEGNAVGKLAREILNELDPADSELVRDKTRAEMVIQERSDQAQEYFREHAAEWDKIRSLHLSETDVETALQEALGKGPLGTMVDLGTGTGRILELFSDQIERGIGIDMNPDMLAYARSNIQNAGLNHCQIRQGDILNVPLDDGMADIVVLHQVLHFTADPAAVVAEACRLLGQNGRLIIVDFAPHELEFLRENYAHLRLGFTKDYLKQCMEKCGLKFDLHRNLQPTGNHNNEQLIVSIWLSTKNEERDGSRNIEQMNKSTGRLGS